MDSVPLIMATAASLGVLGALLNTAHGWLSQYRPPSKHRLVRFAPAFYGSFGFGYEDYLPCFAVMPNIPRENLSFTYFQAS